MTETMDWKVLIGQYIAARRALAAVDSIGLYRYRLPRAAASESQLSRAEAVLGCELPEGYRNFLLHACGWQAFYQDVDLFGSEELLGGGLWRKATECLADIENETLFGAGVDRAHLLPIAVSADDIDLFVLTTKKASEPGQVIWFAGGAVDRYADFHAFFVSMLALVGKSVEGLRSDVQGLIKKGITTIPE